MSRIIYFILIFIVVGQNLSAQTNFQKILFHTDGSTDLVALEARLMEDIGLRYMSLQAKRIFNDPDIYSLPVPSQNVNESILLMQEFPGILAVSEDIPLQTRYTPDDTYLADQWYLQKIDALESWNIAKGGLSPNGDTIVLAILDDGFFSDHEDLQDNIWYNRQEIQGDGIDNDENGYIDDFKGLNVATGDDFHTVKEHGTAVAGIAGARGDNGIGTAGVALEVKLMLISEANSLSNVIEGYQYVRDMRRRYNESGGEEGAYIVATNLSAGINRVFPEDNPFFLEWCNLYESLGEEGVLSVNSTTNSNTNIDEEGDMPGTCPSDYLIIVTNSNQSDQKVIDAGYGTVSVDMAAPGIDILTTGLANEYGSFNGASSSAPQVTGAIALLYNAPCEVFAQQVLDNPSIAALQVKEMILMGVDPVADLSDKVNSGGRLNVLSSLAILRDFCGGSTGQLEIIQAWPNPVSGRLQIQYEAENFELHRIEIANTLGQLVYSESFHPDYFGDKIFEIELGDFNIPNGMYIATIKSEEDIASVKLWIGSIGN